MSRDYRARGLVQQILSGAVAILSSTATALIGYTTGAGGAVTQLTSKSAGVTINSPCGQITMNNAALAAGATVTFLVTNSLVTVTDAIVLNLKGGQVSNGTYRIWVDRIQAGSFSVTVENRSAGSLSEALILNYAIISGATA